MIKNIKKIVLIGSLILAGGVYTGGNFDESSNKGEKYSKNSYLTENPLLNDNIKLISKNYFDKLGNYTSLNKAKKQYEEYKKSELEKMLKEIALKEESLKPKEFRLTPDSLNACIKQAYTNVKKWPKEFDKRLFRLMLKQESQYDVYARSPTGYIGLGQIGASVVETFRPEKFATFKDSTDLEKFLFNPVENISLSLEYLNYLSNFCEKKDPNWKNKNLEEKRKTILICYNAGHGMISSKNVNWNLKSEKLKEENRDYPEIIMKSYYDPKVKVKI